MECTGLAVDPNVPAATKPTCNIWPGQFTETVHGEAVPLSLAVSC